MNGYVDSSVVVRRLLREPGAIQDWSRWQNAISSELTAVEAFRALDRIRITARLPDAEVAQLVSLLKALLSGLERIPISAAVLQRACLLRRCCGPKIAGSPSRSSVTTGARRSQRRPPAWMSG